MLTLRPFLLPSTVFLAICSHFTAALTFTTPNEPDPSHFDPICHCLPDQTCWPSSAVWSAFNLTLNGNLIETFPAAHECHDPYYDEAKCDEINKGHYEENWRGTKPGALHQTNWETFHGQGCLGTNQSIPCYQGSVPVYTVKAMSIADIQETIRFAAAHNIRLAIKNTGHDFLGRSTAPSSISLWVAAMDDIQVVDLFVAEGAPRDSQGEAAIVLGPGVVWRDVYKVIDPYNRVVVGGAHGSVGAVGGYCLGGGHGPLSPRHGLCADNVLQYKVVTADGQVRITNGYQNQDLFWSLRGGSPGFAVVVEAVYRTHPAPNGLNYAQVAIFSNDADSMMKVIRDFYSRHDSWSKEGWSGHAATRSNAFAIQYVLPDASVDQAKASMQPFLDYAHSFHNVVVNDIIDHYPTIYTLFQSREDDVFGERTAGVNALLGSRLIPHVMFQSDHGIDLLSSTVAKVQKDLTGVWSQAGILMEFVGGGQVSQGNSQDTSVLPAWRDALVLVIGIIEWNDDTPFSTQLAHQQKLTKSIDHLRNITPGGGTYQNEADPNEPDWQESFFGANYPRLRSIHDKYDPDGLFVCRRCVGSEDWDNDMLCRFHY
ncbi:hypothetical protein BGZ83_002550 [Gryganskiella cystojenkinii]|nr:hypothetical protein BGZ83_002550 [Gryganskiella cystojenkinii]